MESGARNSFVAIAKIVRARGNKGEVLADLYTGFPARFQKLREVWIGFPDGRRSRHDLEYSWRHKGRQVLKFVGVDSIGAAEAFVGAWVEVERGEAVELPNGTYFDHDLIGCRVLDTSGADLGTVVDLLRISGNSQLIVRAGSREFMIPAAAPLCRHISIDLKQIVVELPEGLIDLNEI